ncbi:MAG TPA: ABC transporter permease, partial [Azospirillum sp.]
VELPPPAAGHDAEVAIEAHGLTKRFGDFVAVDPVDLRIERGEIFGFLGSNGCGKTTTMKMLTGLLPASAGEARLFGAPVKPKDLETRRRVGYMAQAFSLYGELTVRQNLDLHARLFDLAAGERVLGRSRSGSKEPLSPRGRGVGERGGTLGRAEDIDFPASAGKAPSPQTPLPQGERGFHTSRLAHLVDRFGLAPYLDAVADGLPLGVRQRLSLAVAILHEPELLILDEPTSGVDPVARDVFWTDLVALSREQGVTIFVSTHFMNEAARCDRVAFMNAGRVIAVGPPDELRRQQNAATLDDAFIGTMRQSAADAEDAVPDAAPAAAPTERPPEKRRAFSPRRLLAYAWREALELRRDAVRLTVALLGTVLLMLVFGYGITMDVEDLTFAVLDRDQTPESRAYVEQFSGSPYFLERPPIADEAELGRRMQENDVTLAIEIPPGFGRDLRRGRAPEIAVRIDGAMPFRAETIQGYVAGLHQRFIADRALEAGTALPPPAATVEARYRYNQAFRSLDAMVPATIGLLLVFIPAILAALGVVREKELGSITNLYVTPVTRLEFLLGKQIPYVALASFNLVLMVLMAVTLFGVPIKGSVAGLLLGGFVYVCATTALGLLISTFTRTQTAAIFGTAIATTMPAVQFSGMLQPVSTLDGPARVIGALFPTTHFLKVSLGAFTKGLGFADLLPFIGATALFVPALVVLSLIFLDKQER